VRGPRPGFMLASGRHDGAFLEISRAHGAKGRMPRKANGQFYQRALLLVSGGRDRLGR
jgi:hypothetical protein